MVTITVTALDSSGNPVPGQIVAISATGSQNTIAQPALPTDANGVAVGMLTTLFAEVKTISAIFNPGVDDLVCGETSISEFVWPTLATFFVRESGNDLDVGTSPNHAWRSISRAAQQVVPGDTVHVGAGTYPENIVVTTVGTFAEPIRFLADRAGLFTGDAGDVVVDAGGGAFAFQFDGAEWTSLQGFTITGAAPGASEGGGVHGASALSQAIGIEGCAIYGNDRGIDVENGLAWVIESNSISANLGLEGDGIRLSSAENFSIANNLIYGNARYGVGILGGVEGLSVELCTLYQNGSDQIHEEGGGNFGLVANCILAEGLGDGFELVAGSLLLERNNVIFNHSGSEVQGDDGMPDASDVLADPLLDDPDGVDGSLGGEGGNDDNFRLESGSPALDAGDKDAADAALFFGSELNAYTNRSDEILDGTSPDGAVLNLGHHSPADIDVLDLLTPGDVRLFYGKGDEVQLLARTWSRTTGAWFPERKAYPTNATVKWVVSKASPLTLQEEFLAVLTDDGVDTELFVRLWNGKAWTAGSGFETLDSSVPSANSDQRFFDLEYEQASGELLFVYSDDTNNPRSRVYRQGMWEPEAAVFSAPLTTGAIRWIEMAARTGTNEIALVCLDENENLVAVVWDGTQWDEAGTVVLLDDNITTVNESQAFDAVYETLSGDLMVVWGFTTLIEETRYAVKPADSGNWIIGQVNSTDAIGAIMRLSADPGSDKIVCGVSEGVLGLDTVGMVWTGAAWGNIAEFDLLGAPGVRDLGVAWVGTSGTAICVFKDDDGGGGIDWTRFTSNGWQMQPDVLVPGMGDLDFIEMQPIRGQDRLMCVYKDDIGQIWGFTNTGSSWTLTNSAAPLQSDLASFGASSQPFSFAVK